MAGSGIRPAGASASPGEAARVLVWDVFVRLFHWTVALVVCLNLFVVEEGDAIHRYGGYAVLALLVLRTIWGVVGTRHARFSDFVPGPGRLGAYLVDVVRGRQRRHVGHNPAGGAMVVALMAMLAAVGVTGWMQTLDAYWGIRWVEELHETLANLLMVMVAFHLIGVAYESLRFRENLVAAMITGWKRR